MQRITRLLKQIDLFGVPVKILTEEAEEKFQSVQGGLISILISVTSVVYLIYMLNLWGSGNISPSISSSQNMLQYAEFQWQDEMINFRLQDPASKIDPFSKKNNIITPLLFEVVNYQITEAPEVLFSDESLPSQFGIKNGSVVLNNLNIKDDSHKPFSGYLLILAACNDTFMTENSTCASQEEIDKYFSEFHGFLAISIKLKQFNAETRKVETITKSSFSAISPLYPQYTQLYIKQQETIIDDGILFSDYKYHQSPNDFSVINQMTDSEYISNIVKSFSYSKFNYQLESLISFQINIDNISMKQNISMPKLNQVLASIGSIVQVIFFLKYLAFYVNSNQIDEQQYHQIVQMYYPNLKNIEIKRNVLGKAKAAKHQMANKQISENFISQYQQLIEIAKSKSRFINILYEISRLQLLFEQKFGFDSIQGCHDLGSKDNFSKDQNSFRIIEPNETFKENQDFREIIRILIREQSKCQLNGN